MSTENPISTAEGGLVYLIEDDEIVMHACGQALRLAGIPVRGFGAAETALASIGDERPAAVICDVQLPGMDGMSLLVDLLRLDRNLPVILITGHGDISLAVEAMRAGAYDFIEKPFHSERLVDVVRRAMERRALATENQRLKDQLQELQVTPLIGQSPAIQQVRKLIAALAPTSADLLVCGETGSGKEVLAKAVHTASGRRGAFVALNCAAVPESIFESEMFGHEAGAFTGASRRRIGKIEYAQGGTLFLDEIESMPLNLQAKLLRVLQERYVERLGSNTPIPVDCRVIAATKLDLKQACDQGEFRADLYYRLNVVSIELPPLRKRIDDIPLLMAYFIAVAARRYQCEPPQWSSHDLLRWQQHDWPGNVRELRNTAERFCLGVEDGLVQPPDNADSLAYRLEQTEHELIQEALRNCAGNVVHAAKLLKISRKTLYDKLNRLAIDPSGFRQ